MATVLAYALWAALMVPVFALGFLGFVGLVWLSLPRREGI